MSPRYQPPTVETVPELMDEVLEPKPAEVLPVSAPEEGLGIPAAQGLPCQDTPGRDFKHHRLPVAFTRRPERRVAASRISRPRSERSSRRPTKPAKRPGEPRDPSNSEPLFSERDDEHRPDGESGEESAESSRPRHAASPTMFNPAALSLLGPTDTRSGSSSGSGSTVTPASYMHSGEEEPPRGDKPDALSFLDPDSPAVTDESIQRTVAEAATHWHESDMPTSPQSASSSSSASSTNLDSLRSDGGSEQDTEPSTSPEQSVNGDIVSTTFTQVASSPQDCASPLDRAQLVANMRGVRRRQQRGFSQVQAEAKAHRYGTPEMPRGNANLPHLPPNALTPRVGHGHVKHLPRAEKLPLTGYELLAERLSSHANTRQSRNRRRGARHANQENLEESRSPSSKLSGDEETSTPPALPPIYRRFEALNHRLLLHLQDELSELEEQLHRLDTADTQTRRLQNCILPASRRAEYMAGGELQWHKTDILGKIGFKLGQYNHVLSSFTSTQNLPTPSMPDVQSYRTYLATHNPIAEIETRFLDPVEDLVSLAPRRSNHQPTSFSDTDSSSADYSPFSDGAVTPIPSKTTPHFGNPNSADPADPPSSAWTSRSPYQRPDTRGGGERTTTTTTTTTTTNKDGTAPTAAAAPPRPRQGSSAREEPPPPPPSSSHTLQMAMVAAAAVAVAVAVPAAVPLLGASRAIGGVAGCVGVLALLTVLVAGLEHRAAAAGVLGISLGGAVRV